MWSSLKNQIEFYREYIQRNPSWQFAAVYFDTASGLRSSHRPGYQQMLRDCRKKKIDLIFVKSLSRFGRDTAETIKQIRRLKCMNIGVYIETGGINTLTASDSIIDQLAALDVTGLAALEELEAGMNQLTTLDVTHNPLLWSLSETNNQLTALDVTHNPELMRLQCAINQLSTLDLGAQEAMSYIDCAGNGMTACALNDFYFSLPPYEKPASSQPGMETFSLWVLYDEDATPNDATHAEHLIATSKGWTVNQEGDGTGCEEVYVVAKEAENGTVRLLNGETELPASGGKVAKGATVSVQAEPATGYELSSLRANGQDVLAAGEFVASRFTEVVARFSQEGSGIDEVDSHVTLLNVHGGLQVLADGDVQVSVYALSGVLLQRQNLSGNGHIALEAGAYVVSLEADGQQVTKAVVVW